MRKVERVLRERIKALETKVQELEQDRELFRSHFVDRFKWWIKLLGEKSTPNMAWLVEADAIWLRKFKAWYW